MSNSKQYYVDNSGVIYMASLKKGKSASFRLTLTLSEKVKPELLQRALESIAPRFPTIVAGIRNGVFRHRIVPVDRAPDICRDSDLLVYMSRKQIKTCGIRVFYGDTHIAVEFFHSLTDGSGGMEFLKALGAEYLRLAYGVDCSGDEAILPLDHMAQEETEDSFLNYAGGKKKGFGGRCSYLPGDKKGDVPLSETEGTFDMSEVLKAAHRYGVSVTTFLTAVLTEAVMELQILHQKQGEKFKPVHIMVPINLRRRFPSKTLHNFSLYALPGIEPEERKLPFEQLIRRIDHQLREQFSDEKLKAMMASTVMFERNVLLRILPLPIKCGILRIGNYLFGGRTSSLTLSNLGEIRLPENMTPYVKKIGVLLSERVHSAYNCGVLSYNGVLSVYFSRNCAEPELESIFFGKLCKMGCQAKIS